MITITQQHLINISVLDSSTSNVTLKVQASSNIPGAILTYTWEYFDPIDAGDYVNILTYKTTYGEDYGIVQGNTLTIVGTVYQKIQERTGNSVRCTVTDNKGSTPVTTTAAQIEVIRPWYLGADSSVLPKDGSATFPITEDKYVKGGTHVYATSAELCDAENTQRRLKAGQIGIVAEQGQLPKAYRFVTENAVDTFFNNPVPWEIGKDWIETPLIFANTDDQTIAIIDNKLTYIGGGEMPVVDDKTIKIVNNMLSATLYDQDLNTYNSVHFHDVTTNVVVENTLPIQTYYYATSSTVGRPTLASINNSNAPTGPFNVLTVNADSSKYIPLDLSRANTFTLTVSSPSNQIGTYNGFVLLNQAPLISAVNVSLSPNTTYNTYSIPDAIKGRIYTITLFVKHLGVMSTLPLSLYRGSVHTNGSGNADTFTVTPIPVKWSGGSAPALYTTPGNPSYTLGSEDVIMYTTYDGGESWYGFIGGTNLW